MVEGGAGAVTFGLGLTFGLYIDIVSELLVTCQEAKLTSAFRPLGTAEHDSLVLP